MASADYRLCDVCGCKAFYDANLSYDFDAPPDEQYRVCGTNKWGLALGSLGDWAVICKDCAKTHRTQIVEITEQEGK